MNAKIVFDDPHVSVVLVDVSYMKDPGAVQPITTDLVGSVILGAAAVVAIVIRFRNRGN